MTNNWILKRVFAFALIFVLLWFSAGVFDYIMAVCLYKEPFFCIKNGDQNGGFYHGIGYSYVITGNFDKENTKIPFGGEYIEFEIFGKRIETLIRFKERGETK